MRARILFSGSLLIAFFALATAHPQQKAISNPTNARLASAKNILVVRAHGNNIPYEVIKSTIEGWGRFTLVEKTEQADLVVQVSSSGGDGSISVSSSSRDLAAENGRYDQSTRTNRDVSSTDITMTVVDAKDRRVLWIATETAKFAVKEKARENNMVEAAERLTTKFHDRLEPPIQSSN